MCIYIYIYFFQGLGPKRRELLMETGCTPPARGAWGGWAEVLSAPWPRNPGIRADVAWARNI